MTDLPGDGDDRARSVQLEKQLHLTELELQRVHSPVTIDMLKPRQRDFSRVLDALHVSSASAIINLQGRTGIGLNLAALE